MFLLQMLLEQEKEENEEDVIEAMEGVKTDGPRGIERKKMSMLRRKVAQRLVSVKNDTAMLTTFGDMSQSCY